MRWTIGTGFAGQEIEQLKEENNHLKERIQKMKRCEICKHYKGGNCNYHSNWVKECKENKMKLFELKENE